MNPQFVNLRPRRWLLAALCWPVMACAAGQACREGDAGASGQGVAMMVGADVSTLEMVERGGARFADAEGRPADALALLRRAGFNWGRLRLWHTPVNAEDVVEDGRLISRRGEPVGGGSNDLALTIRLARRLQAAGLKWLLDIHYSDFWADPAHQRKPEAWRRLQGPQLAAAVRGYTTELLLQLHRAGVTPDMVQLGNEINGGFLWPDGKTWRATPDEAIGGEAGFVALMAAANEGLAAAERETGRRVPVMIHLAHESSGHSLPTFEHMFDLLRRSGLRMDLIGLSWYPYYHDSLPRMRENLQQLSQRYGLPVVVAETAYGYQPDNAADGPALFNREAEARSGYPATPAGQRQLLLDVAQAVRAAPTGRGVFYWEPAWLGVTGAGWRTNDANGWANQALFDRRGRALPALGALAEGLAAAAACADQSR